MLTYCTLGLYTNHTCLLHINELAASPSFCSAVSVVKAHRVQDGAVKPCTKGKSVSVATNRPFWLIDLLPSV